MIEKHIAVKDVFHTGHVPIAQQLVNSILHKLELKKYFEDRITIESLGTTIVGPTYPQSDLEVNESGVIAEVTFGRPSPGSTTDSVASAASHQEAFGSISGNHKLLNVFHDPTYKFRMVEYEKPFQIRMNMRITITDIVNTVDCISKVQSLMDNGIMTYNVDYGYYLPFDAYGSLYLLHKMGYPDQSTFTDYLTENSGGAIKKIHNRHDTKDVALFMNRKKTGLLAKLTLDDENGSPEGQGKSPDRYVLNISVESQLAMVTMLGLAYPPVVYNKMIPANLAPIKDEVPQDSESVSHPLRNIDDFRNAIKYAFDAYFPIINPWYDKFRPSLPPHMVVLVSNIILLDDEENEDGVTTLPLEAAFGDKLGTLFELTKTLGSKVLAYSTPVHIGIYQDNVLMEPEEIVYDVDTISITTGVRDLTKTYRLIIAFNPAATGTPEEMRTMHYDLIGKSK
jgi:hypothetical protein